MEKARKREQWWAAALVTDMHPTFVFHHVSYKMKSAACLTQIYFNCWCASSISATWNMVFGFFCFVFFSIIPLKEPNMWGSDCCWLSAIAWLKRWHNISHPFNLSSYTARNTRSHVNGNVGLNLNVFVILQVCCTRVDFLYFRASEWVCVCVGGGSFYVLAPIPTALCYYGCWSQVS